MERCFRDTSMPLIKAFQAHKCLNPMVTDRYLDCDHLKPLVDLLDVADGDKLRKELVVIKPFLLTTIATNAFFNDIWK